MLLYPMIYSNLRLFLFDPFNPGDNGGSVSGLGFELCGGWVCNLIWVVVVIVVVSGRGWSSGWHSNCGDGAVAVGFVCGCR